MSLLVGGGWQLTDINTTPTKLFLVVLGCWLSCGNKKYTGRKYKRLLSRQPSGPSLPAVQSLIFDISTVLIHSFPHLDSKPLI